MSNFRDPPSSSSSEPSKKRYKSDRVTFLQDLIREKEVTLSKFSLEILKWVSEKTSWKTKEVESGLSSGESNLLTLIEGNISEYKLMEKALKSEIA